MTSENSTIQTKKQFSLPTLLRGVGALIVIAGMCSYLMEGWEAWNGISRYFVMVGGSSLLALAGLAMSYGLRENKGARVFLSLALISVLANITTLGGFIYSAFGPVASNTLVVGILNMDWGIPENTWLTGMLATVLFVLSPISLFAYKILNRPHANELLAVFLTGSALLLIPMRESFAVGLLILAAVVIPIIYLHRKARDNAHFKTNEGRFTAISLFAPAIIMISRLFWLYEADALIGWILCAISFGASRYLAATVNFSKTGQQLNEVFSGVMAGVLGAVTCYLAEPFLAEELVAVTGVAVFSGLIVLMGQQLPEKNESYRVFAVLILVIFTGINTLIFDSGLASLVAMLIGGLVVVLGFTTRNTKVLLWGSLLMVVAILPYALEFIGAVDFTNWITLAVLGVTAIVAGSFIERKVRKEG